MKNGLSYLPPLKCLSNAGLDVVIFLSLVKKNIRFRMGTVTLEIF